MHELVNSDQPVSPPVHEAVSQLLRGLADLALHPCGGNKGIRTLSHRVKVMIILDRKALEATLLNVPFSRSVVVRMVPHCVSTCSTAEKTTHLAINLRA